MLRNIVPDKPTVDQSQRELPPTMKGVVFERLHSHHDHRGSLTPAIDVRNQFWSEPIVYAYVMTIRPGRIKGWGMHKLQTDRYCVLKGDVRVVLFDGESFSEFFFTENSTGLLQIPPGVWHAAQNWGTTDALIANYPTRPFDPASPDKYRIDPHSGEIPFDWTLRDG